jgi:hypothetical protein
MMDGIGSIGSFGSLSQMSLSIFNKLDSNGDGQVAKSEMEAVCANGGPSVDEIFTSLDTGEDGTISQEEWSSAVSQMGPPPPPPPYILFGNWGDERTSNSTSGTNSDQEEAGAVSHSRGPSTDGMFAKMDTDGDGVISKDELESALAEMGPPPPPPPPPNSTFGAQGDGQTSDSASIGSSANRDIQSLIQDRLARMVDRYSQLQSIDQDSKSSGQSLATA